MKKIFIGALILLGLNFCLAQSKYKFGITAGPNYYSLRGSEFVDKADAKLGYFGGFSLEYKLNSEWSLVANVNYERLRIGNNSSFFRRYIIDGVPTEIYYDATTVNNYDYLNLPVLIKSSFGSDKSFFINIGAFYSRRLSVEIERDITMDEIYSNKIQESKKDIRFAAPEANFPLASAMNISDFGLVFGGGKKIQFEKSCLNIEIRNNLGLRNRVSGVDNDGLKGVIKTNTLSLATQISFN